MRISDWSSDVCSSDLTPAPPRSPRWHRASFPAPVGAPLERGGAAAVALVDAAFDVFDEAARAFVAGLQRAGVVQAAGRGARLVAQGVAVDPQDRKSVGQGKSVSVRVDLGGCRIIQKK